MNANRQITFNDYSSCVQNQIAFLIDEGVLYAGAEITSANLREYYAHGVSVDAAASDAR